MKHNHLRTPKHNPFSIVETPSRLECTHDLNFFEGEGWRKREGKRRIEMGEKENQGRQKERKKKGRKEKEREKASRGQEGISPPPRKKKILTKKIARENLRIGSGWA